jgi:hypothetical protein
MIHLPETEALLIAYSGGKDSLAVLDLAVASGKRVEAFFMFFIPGMDYTAHWTDLARRRYGIVVREYLHFGSIGMLRNGVFRSYPIDAPAVSITDIEAKARQDSGIEWIGYGYKSVDSLERRGMIHSWPGGICHDARGKIFAPLKDWKNRDVFAYLTRRKLPIPRGDGSTRDFGIDAMPATLAWLREHWPDDYKRILKVFPFAAAQADRAEPLRLAKEATRKQRRVEQQQQRKQRQQPTCREDKPADLQQQPA